MSVWASTTDPVTLPGKSTVPTAPKCALAPALAAWLAVAVRVLAVTA